MWADSLKGSLYLGFRVESHGNTLPCEERCRARQATGGVYGIGLAVSPSTIAALVNPFRTAVSFWGQLGTNYLEFECFVPKTGLEF